MLNTSVAPWPSFSDEEIAAVEEILRSGRVNQWTGEHVCAFEAEFAHFSGCKHAVAVNNGTLALDLALRGLRIGPGDEVIVTPRTFIASISSVVNVGATPVFADIDRDSGNISPATIRKVLTAKSKAIVAVHLAGWPCDMPEIMQLAHDHGLLVIEDCAQAHGAQIDGQSIGSFGHAAAWSFCQDKIMTTGGEGGMVTCNDDALWDRMWSMKDHGKSYDAVFNRDHPPGFRWVHESFGHNWRMLEMQAAIGRIQLRRMAEWSARRAAIAAHYAAIFAPFGDAIRVPAPPQHYRHGWYRFYAYIDPSALNSGWDRDRIVAEVTAQGIPIMQGSCSEVYLEKAFDGTGWRPEQRLPHALELGATSLMLLTHPTLTDADLARTSAVVSSVLNQAFLPS